MTTGDYGEPCGCPEDLRICEDGSSVKRDPYNNCNFAACDGLPPQPPPPPKCCDPLEQPGAFGNPFCIEGAACCPDGTWSCSIGDGRTFPCEGGLIDSGFGQACPLDCSVCPGGFFDGCNTVRSVLVAQGTLSQEHATKMVRRHLAVLKMLKNARTVPLSTGIPSMDVSSFLAR